SKWRQDALELEVAPSVIRRPMFSNRPIRGEHYDEAFRISRSRIPRDGLRECRPWSAHCFQKWQTKYCSTCPTKKRASAELPSAQSDSVRTDNFRSKGENATHWVTSLR